MRETGKRLGKENNLRNYGLTFLDSIVEFGSNL